MLVVVCMTTKLTVYEPNYERDYSFSSSELIV